MLTNRVGPARDELNSNELEALILYVIDTGHFEGWYDKAYIEQYRTSSPEHAVTTEYIAGLTEFLCKLIDHMSDTLKQKIMYDGRSKMARRLADWWDTHQDYEYAKVVEIEETEEMEYMSKFIPLDKNTAPVIRGFLEGFLEIMDHEDHFMSYREGMDAVLNLSYQLEHDSTA